MKTHSTALAALVVLTLASCACSFNLPLSAPLPRHASRPTCVSGVKVASMQMPDAPIKIPDTFNPAEWSRPGGGGGDLGSGLEGFRVPDSFNPSDLEREKEGGRTAVMDRPKDRLDPGKKYKVLLFNDEKNTREYVIDTLIKCIPGMSVDKAKLITQEAHSTGMAVVGIWMFELAEAYADVLRSAGLKSDVEEE